MAISEKKLQVILILVIAMIMSFAGCLSSRSSQNSSPITAKPTDSEETSPENTSGSGDSGETPPENTLPEDRPKEPEIKSALVFCHPYVIDSFMSEQHFLNPVFQKYIRDLGSDPADYLVETVDPYGRATYKEDAFGSSFLNEHRDKYDLVWVPDCGGDWYYFQNGPKRNYGKFYELITKAISLAKKGGRILISKVFDEDFKAKLEKDPKTSQKKFEYITFFEFHK